MLTFKFVPIWLVVVIDLFFVYPVLGQPDLTSTEVPQTTFANDICAPPCWFGLTPGSSTSAQVEQMLIDFSALFIWDYSAAEERDSITGQIIQGTYTLYWKNIRPDDQLPTFIVIEDRIT